MQGLQRQMYAKVLGLHCQYTPHTSVTPCWGQRVLSHMMGTRQLTVLRWNGTLRFLCIALVFVTNSVILGCHALVPSLALRISLSLTFPALTTSLSTSVTAKMSRCQIGRNCSVKDGFLQCFNVPKLSLHSSVSKPSTNWPSKGKQTYMTTIILFCDYLIMPTYLLPS